VQTVEQGVLHHAILDDVPSTSACTLAAEKWICPVPLPSQTCMSL
jgi:hypothetical protein